ALLDRPFGDHLADRLGALDVAAARRLVERALERRLDGRRRDQRLAAHVVDHLGVDVRDAAEHAEARPVGRARDPLALPQLDPDAAIVFGFYLHKQKLSAIGYQLSAISYQLSAISYQLSINHPISHQPSAISHLLCAGLAGLLLQHFA